MRYVPVLCLIAVSVMATCVFLIWRDKEKPAFNALLKSIASFCFLALAVVATFVSDNFTMPMLFILLGLTSSVFGDVFLGFRDFKNEHHDKALYSGFSAFIVTQILYLLGLIFLFGFNWWSFLLGGLITLTITLSEGLLKLDFGKFRIIVIVYSLLLMTVMSQGVFSFAKYGFSTSNLLLMLGVIFFAISDLILSFIYFKKDSKDWLNILNYLTYYLAQIMIATSLMFI